MQPFKEQYIGCLLGLAVGDALGAPHEGGPLERLLWKCIGRTSDGLPRWTDDTQMSLDTAHSLLSCGGLDEDDLAHRFAASYRWSRGYGPGTARLLKRIRNGEHWRSAATSAFKSGSFGNGAAMRATVLALFYCKDFEGLVAATRRAAAITHAHPLGIEGSVLIAATAYLMLHCASEQETLARLHGLCTSEAFSGKLRLAENWLAQQAEASPHETAKQFGNGMAATASVVTAIYIALRHLHRPCTELLAFAAACKGDVDTIGAMAGSLWGAYNGADSLMGIPLEQSSEIIRTALQLYAVCEADNDEKSGVAVPRRD